ncbi:DUF6428 family protein [Prosthecobacter sp.]|uniref:DUF6428 family protein n=1 Tax=Prosthecobacter sp. TaxID=1965333 RepID=UPI0037833B58
MNITAFLAALRSNPDKPISLLLPDGGFIPAHFHITEVGHVMKRFIDCGGTRRTLETCLLQTWVHDDLDHRLLAGKLAAIFDKAGDVLPHHDLPVEIEYEDYVVAQFPVESAEIIDGALTFRLGLKHTDCLARGICLPGECAPAPKAAPAQCCTPGSACC